MAIEWTYACALVIGLLMGMFGGGGSILAVPVLVYVTGFSGKQAIGVSVLTVGIASLVAGINHARRGHVDLKAALAFLPTALLGAFLGGLGTAYVPDPVLLGLFGVMMLGAAVAMLRGRPEGEEGGPQAPVWKIALAGGGIGMFTGLVGAGGGFMIVPALVLLCRMPMHTAVGTSLILISLKSAAAFVGHVGHTVLDPQFIFIFIGICVAGALLGTRLSERIPAQKLRRGFAYFVLVLGVVMLVTTLVTSLR